MRAHLLNNHLKVYVLMKWPMNSNIKLLASKIIHTTLKFHFYPSLLPFTKEKKMHRLGLLLLRFLQSIGHGHGDSSGEPSRRSAWDRRYYSLATAMATPPATTSPSFSTHCSSTPTRCRRPLHTSISLFCFSTCLHFPCYFFSDLIRVLTNLLRIKIVTKNVLFCNK